MIILILIINILLGAYIAWLEIVFAGEINSADCKVAKLLGDVSKVTFNPFEDIY